MTRTSRVLLLCAWLAALPVAAQSLPAPLDEATGAAPPASPAQQAERWQRLSPAQREDLRSRYAAWRGLGEGERARVRGARAGLAALPADQQRALRTQFGTQDRLHRQGWRLGPLLGAYYAQLQPLVGYVPAAQRDALVALLRSLEAEQLAQLGVIAQRTPPQDRDALRDELLAQPPAARAAWLKRKLGR